MEEDILNYSPTLMFRGTLCICKCKCNKLLWTKRDYFKIIPNPSFSTCESKTFFCQFGQFIFMKYIVICNIKLSFILYLLTFFLRSWKFLILIQMYEIKNKKYI